MTGRPLNPHQEALKERLTASFEAHVDDLLRDLPYWAPEVQAARIHGRIVALARSLQQIMAHHTHGGSTT